MKTCDKCGHAQDVNGNDWVCENCGTKITIIECRNVFIGAPKFEINGGTDTYKEQGD